MKKSLTWIIGLTFIFLIIFLLRPNQRNYRNLDSIDLNTKTDREIRILPKSVNTSKNSRVDNLPIKNLSELLALNDFKKAYSELLSQEPYMEAELFHTFQRNLLLSWSEEEPDSSSELLLDDKLPQTTREYLQKGLAYGYCKKDLSQAIEYLNTLTDKTCSDETYRACYHIVIDYQSRHEPEQAAESFLNLNENIKLQKSLVETVVLNLANNNENKAREFISEISNEEIRNIAHFHLSSALMEK